MAARDLQFRSRGVTIPKEKRRVKRTVTDVIKLCALIGYAYVLEFKAFLTAIY